MALDFGGSHNSGIISKAIYNNTTGSPLTFSTQTNGEMQLWYYMYTDQMPAVVNGIADNSNKKFQFDVVPNPMNNTGKLVYSLANAASVESSVLDVTGKLIAHMNNETETQGVHEITIGTGEQLASGIYFAKLTVDGITYTKKFIVTE